MASGSSRISALNRNVAACGSFFVGCILCCVAIFPMLGTYQPTTDFPDLLYQTTTATNTLPKARPITSRNKSMGGG